VCSHRNGAHGDFNHCSLAQQDLSELGGGDHSEVSKLQVFLLQSELLLLLVPRSLDFPEDLSLSFVDSGPDFTEKSLDGFLSDIGVLVDCLDGLAHLIDGTRQYDVLLSSLKTVLLLVGCCSTGKEKEKTKKKKERGFLEKVEDPLLQ